MKKITFICILSLFAIQSFGFDSTFDKANKAYQKENYQEALNTYQELIDQGYVSFELYYNLGNTYYRLGKFTEAVWHYEKAKKINPSDDDLLANIQLVNQQFVDDIEAIPSIPFQVWWHQFIYGNNHWYLIALLFVLATIVYTLSFWLSSKVIALRYISLILAFIGVFGLTANRAYYNNRETASEAILFSSNLSVLSEPSNNALMLFSLHQGTKVEIIEQQQEWTKIKIKNGEVGWIPSEGMKVIH